MHGTFALSSSEKSVLFWENRVCRSRPKIALFRKKSKRWDGEMCVCLKIYSRRHMYASGRFPLFSGQEMLPKKVFSFSFAERWNKDFRKRQRRKSYFISSLMVGGEWGAHVYNKEEGFFSFHSRHVTVPS